MSRNERRKQEKERCFGAFRKEEKEILEEGKGDTPQKFL